VFWVEESFPHAPREKKALLAGVDPKTYEKYEREIGDEMNASEARIADHRWWEEASDL